MKKACKCFVAWLLVALLLLAALPVATAAQEDRAITQADALHAEGRKVVNAAGEEVILKGVNVGGWLILEEWSTPYNVKEGNLRALEILEERFGQEEAYRLFNSYYDNFLTEYDIENIASLGFNCVRVPFWYRNFMLDNKGTWIRDKKGEIDLSRLEWIVEECGKRGLYVVLDMHGAPGGQGLNEHCGSYNDCRLFNEDEEGESYRALTVELWREIARRFKGNPTVCMYDILNEPLCDVRASNEQFQMLWQVYDACYDAIREEDPDTTITFECTWRFSHMPRPSKYDWQNVVYQLHLYDKNNGYYDTAILRSLKSPYKVPVIVGEFHPKGSATWDYTLSLFNTMGVGWFIWTYKGVNCWMRDADWFLFIDTDGYEQVDVENDSLAEIERKWGSYLRTDGEHFFSTGFIDKLTPYIEGRTLDKKDRPGFFKKAGAWFGAAFDYVAALFVGF